LAPVHKGPDGADGKKRPCVMPGVGGASTARDKDQGKKGWGGPDYQETGQRLDRRFGAKVNIARRGDHFVLRRGIRTVSMSGSIGRTRQFFGPPQARAAMEGRPGLLGRV